MKNEDTYTRIARLQCRISNEMDNLDSQIKRSDKLFSFDYDSMDDYAKSCKMQDRYVLLLDRFNRLDAIKDNSEVEMEVRG